MNISRPFIERPIATSLLLAGVLLIGIIAYPILPVAPLPQVDFPTIQVSASLPGADPATMASSVAQPLERQFSEIPGVDQITSTSALGTTSITVQFALDRNIDAAAGDIQAAINAAGGQLPKNLPSPPTYRKVNPADRPILIMGVTSDVLPLTTVDDYADTMLAQRISQLEGIGQVSIGGEQKPAIRVQIDPAKLAALGLSLEDVRGVLETATTDSPKGSLTTPTRSFTIYDNDQILEASSLDNVVIAYKDGAPVRIRDIGQAIDGAENTQSAAWQNGKKGVLLIVFKQPGANVIDTVDRVMKALPCLEAAVPPAIRVQILSDRTQTIRASVADVQKTLLITVALVVMVIFVFLRHVWATIIPSVTVPLALLGTAALMYVLGFSLDNLSLMAMTIAVGFVVDDAIVMIENIHRHVEVGLPVREAAIRGAGEIGFTIVSISLSLIAVFIPLLLMGGIVGRLFREFAITVTMTIVVSAMVSLTLTPMLASRFLERDDTTSHGRIYLLFERFFDGMAAGYRRGLDLVLRHQRSTLAFFLATVTAAIALYLIIPKGFFPQQDTGMLIGVSQAAQDVSFPEMERLQQRLTSVVQGDPAVADVVSAIGATGGQTINTGRFFITLKPRSERDVTADQIISRLRPKLAEVEGAVLFLQSAQDVQVGGRLSRTQYQYTLQDPDLTELDTWAPRVLSRLKSMPQLRDVASDEQTNGATLTLTIDRDQAARFGIQPQAIDDTLYDAFGQRQVTQYFTQTNSYHVVMEVLPALQADADTLNQLYVRSQTGQEVPLSTFARWTTRPVAFLSISHQGQFPAVTLSFNLAPGVALGDAVAAIDGTERELGTPATLNATFQGTAQAFQSSLSTQGYLIAAAVVVVYIILGVLYESYIHPLTILSTLPSAGVGALLMLMANGYDLSVIGLVGIILLIGIVKKNGIMMVDFAITAERRDGLSPGAAIRQACLIRFRPIMMTTMAAMLGSLPLMLGHGTGSEFRQPLGYAMVGGLLVSQTLTLFTTPVVYLYLDRLSHRLAGHRARPPRAPSRMQAALASDGE
jgi:hydrophobe/amphiphile efflux-1 (HAE1) family protein